MARKTQAEETFAEITKLSTKKVILGGGITGLIFGYYNPDHIIISKDIGGQMNHVWDLGPRYLHKTPEAKQFLTRLNMPIKERTIKVGYKIGTKILPETTTEYRKKYYHKSRAEPETTDGFNETVMNSGKNTFIALDVNFRELIAKLAEECKTRLIQENAIKIDIPNQIISTQTQEIEYEELISTIPLPIFLSISGNETYLPLFGTIGITYAILNRDFLDLEDNDFVYCAEDEPYHRLTKTDKAIIAELTHKRTKEELEKIFRENLIDSIFVPNIQITKGEGIKTELKNITLAGRYGEWNRSQKTESVISEAIAYAAHN